MCMFVYVRGGGLLRAQLPLIPTLLLPPSPQQVENAFTRLDAKQQSLKHSAVSVQPGKHMIPICTHTLTLETITEAVPANVSFNFYKIQV